ncbi:protein mono-ADP-ribosyltransferase PARP10 [Parambassis ranga]|uniref:Poly [ADP-ribose] polymerase n=1 Tax=Parambassis ranga TaxID=210632 RepID=A0A6P7HK28_9TELE|nr:protein mono-ADP-ribosyltransferase PARP10 [Parambassis ranga]
MPGENLEERTVEVVGLSEKVDEELLCLYFENKRRSGGGSLTSVEKKGNRALLVFEEAEAAARVLSKGHHVLYNSELNVRKPPSQDRCRVLLRGVNPSTSQEMIELYVENMLGLNDTDYTLHPSPGRDLILINLKQPLSKDFQNLSAKLSRRLLDGAKVALEQIEQTDSVLVKNLHPGTTPDLLTLYFESSRGGNHKVKNVTMLSESIAKVSFDNCESVDLVLDHPHKLEDADLILNPYFEFLQPAESVPSQSSDTESQDITGTNSDALNDTQMQTSPPTVVNCSSPTSSQTEELLVVDAAVELSEEVMEHQTEETDALSSHIAITDPVKQTLFQWSTFLQEIQKNNPNFTIQSKDDGVHIVGPDRLQVEQLKNTVVDFLGSMAEISFTLEPEKAQFLARKDVKERLLESLNKTGSSTVYTVSDSNVMVASLTQDSANQACSFLKSQVCHFSLSMDREYEGMLCIREWSEFLQNLGFTSARVSEQRSIDVLTLKGMEDEKQSAILEFLTTPIERETVISMDPGMLKYIQIHCHQLLADMDQVSIFPLEAEDICGLKIHGHAVACQMAEEVLQGVVSSICTRTITVNAPGVSRFLDDTECKSILNEMESKFQVYINPKYVPWEPLPHQDIFETAWNVLAHKNFQKSSVDNSGQGMKSDSMQTDNGASGSGLLEEAKKIVSAIDTTMEDGVSTSDLLDDLNNVDMYTAEEPKSLTDQDVIIVDDPQPSEVQNATLSDVLRLSSNLEEEAQLSLAIQYSMESSHWSFKDEEEQLQKALELSKKMIQDENPPSKTVQSPKVDQLQKRHMSMPLQDAIKAANTIQLDVFAGYSCDLIRVDIAFGKKVSQRQVEEKVEHRCVKNFSEYHRMCLNMIKRKHAVEIEVQGTIITVSGFKDFVHGGMCDLKLLLEKISNSVSDQEILKTIQWVQHDPVSSDMTPYSADTIVFIENAYRRRVEKVNILLDNQPHIINFEKMQEINKASGKTVKISRKLLELGDVSQDVADEEYSLLSNMPEACKVDEESDEFQNVVKSFYETIQEYHSKIRIIQVEKLMNRLLYNQYKLKKASVLQRATYPEIERTLYHGTSESSVKEICLHGFNRSFCGKNATVYGQGVYFAVNSALSVQDQYSPPNTEGYKFVFVSKVLTGDYTKGCHSMKTAPLKETDDIPLRYDSVTDDITKPSMFVIFNDTQAFPEYLITCQRIHR